MPNRSILVTGASSGIGRAAAICLKARGWNVFATARTEEDLQGLRALGLEALRLDYRDKASIAAAANVVIEQSGTGLLALFNNGAYGQPGAVEDLRPDVLEMQFQTNLFGWHDLTCRLLPAMRARGAGRIVQCSSVLGIVAMRYRGAYIASKFALEGLTDTLRLELMGTGIHVSTIRPGPIATRFIESAMAAFDANIDAEHSPHRAAYELRRRQMAKGGASRFKLPPEAVVKKLVHALENPRPRPYYSVTVPTVMMDVARRILPNRAMVGLLGRLSDGGQ